MTALRKVVLRCDTKECESKWVGPAGPGPGSITWARNQAKLDGWRHQREGGLGNALFVDLCPVHAGEDDRAE